MNSPSILATTIFNELQTVPDWARYVVLEGSTFPPVRAALTQPDIGHDFVGIHDIHKHNISYAILNIVNASFNH